MNPPARVLLIECETALEARIREVLVAPGVGSFEVECVSTVSEGLKRLDGGEISAIIAALYLPDSEGIATFDALFAAAPQIPILILSDETREAVAVEAVSKGAQDYLLPDHLDGYSLLRAVRNAIERKTAEDALFVERDRAQVTLNSIGDAVLCTGVSGDITYLNLAAERITGWSDRDAHGRPLAEVFRLVDGLTREKVGNPQQMAVHQNRTFSLGANCVLVRRDGSELDIEDSTAPIHDRAGRVIGAVIVFRDVSAVRLISNRVAYLAEHDPLTDLPNRLVLKDRMAQSIALARHHGRPLAVMFLDLDHFKQINDSLGHDIGDKLLQSIAARLLAAVRSSDTVSRHGGDEFVILLSEIAHPEDAATCAQKLLDAVSAPHLLNGHDVRINCSLGISVYPEDGDDEETLIGHADTAMYHAKGRGRNNFQFFEAEMTVMAKTRQSIEDSLSHAVARGELLLHYQPIVHLSTGQIVGVEALLRWQHPERGLLYPDAFVRVAEECGLIVELGRWVLKQACAQAREWEDLGLPGMMVYVNVSAVEFRDKNFVRGVDRILRDSRLDARHLKLEVTEGVLMQDIESTVLLLQAVKALGVQLAVDDFGTGYSSLSYLRQFPIDVLKIDRSFVQQITDIPTSRAIVNAILAMGESLGYLVVAEGIETELQKEFLQSRTCTMGQGYLFSKPLPAAQIPELLRSGICLQTSSSFDS